jgi:hypothetical protein
MAKYFCCRQTELPHIQYLGNTQDRENSALSQLQVRLQQAQIVNGPIFVVETKLQLIRAGVGVSLPTVFISRLSDLCVLVAALCATVCYPLNGGMPFVVEAAKQAQIVEARPDSSWWKPFQATTDQAGVLGVSFGFISRLWSVRPGWQPSAQYLSSQRWHAFLCS